MQLEQENLSYSLYVTDVVYEILMEVLIEQELILTDFLRLKVSDNIYLKRSDIYDVEGVFLFEYIFDVLDEELIIEIPIGDSVSKATYQTHTSTFRDFAQLEDFLYKVI